MMDLVAILCGNFALSHDIIRHSAWLYDEECTEVLPQGVPLPNPANRKRGRGKDLNDDEYLSYVCVAVDYGGVAFPLTCQRYCSFLGGIASYRLGLVLGMTKFA